MTGPEGDWDIHPPSFLSEQEPTLISLISKGICVTLVCMCNCKFPQMLSSPH